MRLSRALLAGVLCLLAQAVSPAQTTWFVDDDNCPGPGAGTASDPFCAIQAGLDAAADGDTVLIADGLYQGAGNRDLVLGGKAITLRSANGPSECVIDCEFLGRGFSFDAEGPDSMVVGLTIRNGEAQGVGAVGGAVHCTSAATPTFVECEFSACVTTAAVLEDLSAPLFERCRFAGNSGSYGGAVGVYDAADVTLLACAFTDNDAYLGGAVAWSPHDAGAPHAGSLVSDCTFVRNTTGFWGGALFVFRVDLPVLHCTFTENAADWGGAIAVVGDGWVGTPNTILDLRGSLLWNDAANEGDELAVFSSKFGHAAAEVRYCDVRGGEDEVFVYGAPHTVLRWLDGNFELDPLFVDPMNDDFHLRSGSPCIDAGAPDFVPMPGHTDIDGEPRSYAQSVVDVGSDEVHPYRSR